MLSSLTFYSNSSSCHDNLNTVKLNLIMKPEPSRANENKNHLSREVAVAYCDGMSNESRPKCIKLNQEAKQETKQTKQKKNSQAIKK